MELESSSDSLPTARCLLEIVSGLLHDITSTIHHQVHPTPLVLRKFCPDSRLEHRAYLYASGYKHSMASVAGYWAETDVFGGPILFAKGEQSTQVSQPRSLASSVLRYTTSIIN
jgi:hypothetical protein